MKILLFLVVFTATFFGLFTITPVPIFAQGMPGMTDMGGVRTMKPTKNMSPITRFIEVDNDPLFTILDVSLDIVGVIIMITAIFIISKSVSAYGKSTVGVAILYFLTATLVLGAIRLIFILDDDNILNVKDVAEMTAWHTLFYYSIILFYFAGLTFTKLVSTQKGKSSYTRALIVFIFSIFFSGTILLFYSQSIVQDFLVKYEQSTPLYTFGWWHIIAVILSVIIALYLYNVRSKFKGYSSVIGSIIIAIILMASIHTWELLNETWQVIVVSDDFGEFIERVLWIPVFIFILYSFISLRRISNINADSVPVPASTPSVTPNMPSPVSQVPQPVTQAASLQVPQQAVQSSVIQQPTPSASQPTATPEVPSIFLTNTDSVASQKGSDDINKQSV